MLKYSCTAEYVRINKTDERIYKAEDPVKYAELAKKAKASYARANKESCLRSLGLTKVRGAVSGKIYWE